MFNYIYLLVKQRLAQKVPSIKEIAWYMEQDTASKGRLKITPGVYMRFKDTAMRSLGNGVQEGTVEFDLIHLSDCLYDDDQRIYNSVTSGDFNSDFSNDFHNFVSSSATHLDRDIEIHKAVTGYSAKLSDYPGFEALRNTDQDVQVFNTIDRTKVSLPHTQKSIMRSVQTFSCYMKDYSGNKDFQKVTRGFEILNTAILQ